MKGKALLKHSLLKFSPNFSEQPSFASILRLFIAGCSNADIGITTGSQRLMIKVID